MDLHQRAALLGPLRTRKQLQVGLEEAPLGVVTVAFMNVLNVPALMAWDKVRLRLDQIR